MCQMFKSEIISNCLSTLPGSVAKTWGEVGSIGISWGRKDSENGFPRRGDLPSCKKLLKTIETVNILKNIN